MYEIMLNDVNAIKAKLQKALEEAEAECDGWSNDEVENLRYALTHLENVIEALEVCYD